MNARYSMLAFLHRVKERKTPSLSAQASFAPFSLKVARYGKSLIRPMEHSPLIFKFELFFFPFFSPFFSSWEDFPKIL